MKNINRFSWLDWIVLGIFSLISAATAGLGLGYIRETYTKRENLTISSAIELQTQYELGKLDYEAGRYEIARQRFEYILEKEADYPGAMDFLTRTLLRMVEDDVNITQELPKSSKTPTPTLSPTPDTRAVEEIFESALMLYEVMDWHSLVQTLMALRDNDPMYQVSQVDRMLYLAHYFNGIDKILVEGDLEGGLYDLSLAELFVPLDSHAEVYREWARLYQIGMSFWYVYPDRSVYYFGQLAKAAPYIKDLSGVPAITRYRLALIMYGDVLAQGEDWCGAADQYNLAQGIYYDQGKESRQEEINERCQYSIATPTFTITWTYTPSATSTLVTWTATLLSSGTATMAASLTPTLSVTPVSMTPTQSTLTPSPTIPTLTPSPTGGSGEPTITASATMTSTSTANPSATENQPSQTPTFTSSPTPTDTQLP